MVLCREEGARMETRFAGSQRLDERRRRRLVAEADGSTDDASAPVETEALAAPAGRSRSAHRPVSAGNETSAPELPLARVLPAALWKHIAITATLLTVGAGLMAANVFAEQWATTVGPGVMMLFGVEHSPATAWYASLLLLLCSQSAGLIWWGRSRSAKDFDGRYRVWTRIAAVFFAGSAVLACHGHKALSATVRFLARYDGTHSETLAWLVPVSCVGALVLWALHREMRGCRLSLGVVYVAVTLYAISAAAVLDFILLNSVVRQALLVQSAVLAGHVLLLHAMLLHARHVLYHTAEPSAKSRRKWNIPRPHFRWPSLRKFRKSKSESPVEAQDKPPAEKPTAKSKTRIDTKHEPVVAETPLVKNSEPPTAPRREEIRPAASVMPPAPVAPQPVQDERDFIANSVDDDETDEDDGTSDGSPSDDDWSDDQRSRGNLKGLSKKQRRKLLQEQRDRDRRR